LSSWRRERGPQLKNCLKTLQAAFSEAPPVVAKTQTPVAGPPSNSYTPPAAQNLPYPTGNSPYPVGNTSNNPYPVHNAYQPVQNAHQPYMPNPMAQHRPSINHNTIPSYPGAQGNNLPPYPGTNLPSYPGTNTTPYNQPATQAPQRPPQPANFENAANPRNSQNLYNAQPVLNPRQPSVDQTLLIDSQKEYQIERINNYLVAQGDELMKNTSDEISTLDQTKNGLKAREASLNQHFNSMRTEKVDLETKIAQLESVISVKQEEVNKLTKNIDEGINPDEIIQASTPLERQILKCHSEDLAISDAVYYLNSALQRDLLDVDQFLREVRKLGRKQIESDDQESEASWWFEFNVECQNMQFVKKII